MLTVTAPTDLNGEQLRHELAQAGLEVDWRDMYVSEGELYFPSLDEGSTEAVQQVLAQHVADPGFALPADRDRLDAQRRLRDLHSKGWANLSQAERAEVPKHVLALLANST